jgi:NitT/TauT family transport system permease protein
VLLAIATMIVLIIGVNALFWRPLTAWAERFRIEESEAIEAPRSVTLDVLRRSRVPGIVGRPLGRLVYPVDRVAEIFGTTGRPLKTSTARRRIGDALFALTLFGALGYGALRMMAYIAGSVGFTEVGHAALLGLATFARVVVVVVVSTLIWVPIGVWIGMNPKVTRLAQPVVQVLASFPANFLFPLFTALLLATGISINWGGILLMALGTQWYILFNVIAGASAIPTELRDAAASLKLPTVLRWRTLILPGIFGSYVTGGITAAGGAWNASIVAEVVQYQGTTLSAVGLGAYITHATAVGDAPRLLIGVIAMSFYVVTMNIVLWQRLYRLSQRRFSLS